MRRKVKRLRIDTEFINKPKTSELVHECGYEVLGMYLAIISTLIEIDQAFIKTREDIKKIAYLMRVEYSTLYEALARLIGAQILVFASIDKEIVLTNEDLLKASSTKAKFLDPKSALNLEEFLSQKTDSFCVQNESKKEAEIEAKNETENESKSESKSDEFLSQKSAPIYEPNYEQNEANFDTDFVPLFEYQNEYQNESENVYQNELKNKEEIERKNELKSETKTSKKVLKKEPFFVPKNVPFTKQQVNDDMYTYEEYEDNVYYEEDMNEHCEEDVKYIDPISINKQVKDSYLLQDVSDIQVEYKDLLPLINVESKNNQDTYIHKKKNINNPVTSSNTIRCLNNGTRRKIKISNNDNLRDSSSFPRRINQASNLGKVNTRYIGNFSANFEDKQEKTLKKQRISYDGFSIEDDPDLQAKILEVVRYLNAKCKTTFNPSSKRTQLKILERFKEGLSVEDLKAIIDLKNKQWRHQQNMRPYLRPETLFGDKAESYLEEVKQYAKRRQACEFDTSKFKG